MMKRVTLFLKRISGRSLEKALIIAFAGGLATISNGQTQLISASDGGFENATSTFAANGWSTAQPGITRQWQVGTAGGSVTGGTKSAYVGTTTTYNGSTTSGTFHFYRDLAIPAGSTNVLLNYELKYPTLDAGFDYFYVFTTTTANTPVSGTLPGAGYTQIFENDATTYAAFTAMPQVDLTSLAGTTVRLVFTFVTDGITPNAKPAVDNVTLSYTTPTPCSGTPTPGNTVSTASAVCTGTNFTLSMQNNYSGLTYQWQSSPTNSGFTNIAGDTNATLTTSQTAATYYQCVVTCTSSTLSSNSTPVQVGITTLCNYCTPINSTGCTDGDEITNVTFAGINNTTGCSGTGGYNDFTSITGNVNAGQSYPVSITTGTGGGLTNEGVAVWIDFNQNGTFEPTEMVYSGYSGNDPATYTGTIAIPGTALAGTTRMRVRCDFDQAPLDTDPCTVFVFGETEDYDINITPLTPCSGTPAPGATASTATAICNNVNFTLSLPAIVNSGFTYQWQSSPTNSGFTNITGATSASLTTSQTAATYYQCVVTCTSSSSSATSTPIQVTVTTLCNYCVADNTFGCTDGDEITNVTFAGINNTTGCAGDAGGYNDYTTISGNVVTGTAYPITISTGTGGGLTNEGVAVWIDYNQNGVFETTEYVYNSYSGADPATYNGSITIPLTALTGTTRMRVRCEFNSAPLSTDACTVFTFGETEDYSVNIIPLIPCTGTPSPGATASTASVVCGATSFTLSLPTPTTSGLTYQWQSSPTNSGFTNIAGATSATLTTTQTAATYYQCVVTCTSSTLSGISTPLQVGMTTLCNYCTPINSTGCTSGDEITNATFAGINNTTACSGTGGYNDFTAISGNVTIGLTYPITLSTGTGNITNEGVAVWIDYNQNGTFETTEYVYNAYSGADPATYNGSITIPLTALTGPTRMRVRCDFNQAPLSTDPCTVFTFGETEDYTINITSATATIDMGSSTVSAPTVHCYTSAETVSATVKNYSGTAINLATNPVTVNCAVTGANPNNTTFTPIVLNTGTLAAGATQVVTFSTTYNMSAAGTYVITSYTSISGDVSAVNDTTRTTYIRAANPTVTGNASVSTICAGLSETLTGGGAVSYAWSGGVTDGTAFNATTTTTYTVTGTDANGCTNTSTATVTVNQLPTVTGAASLNPICAGLNDTLRGSGATSYVWSGGITDGTAFAVNATATYTVTGTDGNGCVNTSTATITVTPATTTPVAIIGSDSICGGSSGNYYVAAVSGATSYTWTLPSGWVGSSTTDSISVSSVTTSGTISVTADNTCGSSTAQTLNVTAGAVLAQPSSILGVTHLCDSSSTAYAVTNDPNATSYTWTLPSGWSGTSTTSTITATASTTSGVISVTANNGCGSSTPSTLNVVGNTIPTVTVSSFGTVCDNAAAFTLSGGNPSGGTYSGTGVNSNIFDPATTGDGTFMLTYTYANGACIRTDSAAIIVDLCLGINSSTNNGNVNIYPNPTNGMFTIHIGNADFNEMIITVVDIQGREVYKALDKNINSDYSKQISLEGVAKGIYYIKLNYGAESNVQKLIIE